MELPFIVVLAAIVIALPGVRVVGDNERLAVFRGHQFVGLRGPGFQWVIPGIHKTLRVELDAAVPEWRELPKETVDTRVEELLRTGQINMLTPQ